MPKRSGSYSSDSSSHSNNNPNLNKKPKTKRTKKIPKSCLACHRRKVRCDNLSPACSACKRHAKTLGQDPLSIVCEYATTNAARTIGTGPVLGVGVGVERVGSGIDSGIELSAGSSSTTKVKRPKRKNRKKVVVQHNSSEEDEEGDYLTDHRIIKEDEDDDGILKGMGLGKDLRRPPTPSTSSLRIRATPPPYLALPPRREESIIEPESSLSPLIELDPIYFPPAQLPFVASPVSTRSETPLPTPIIEEIEPFNFNNLPTPTEVVQQPYDSLDFLPDNPSPGGRSRSGTINFNNFTPSVSGLINGTLPLWAT